jgi:hypothetical protein
MTSTNEDESFAEPRRVFELLRDLHCPWGIAGGWATDLSLDRITRPHKDIEVAVFRSDQDQMRRHLAARGWDFEKVADGRLQPWKDRDTLSSPVHEIWCRNPAGERLEVLLNERTETEFVFRRDPRARRPVGGTFLRSASGIPVLAPEVVLLYKAKDSREHSLGDEPLAWLSASIARLYPDHAWSARIAALTAG